jgi:hypothetical protein
MFISECLRLFLCCDQLAKFEENELIAVIDDKVTIEFKEYIINNGGS